MMCGGLGEPIIEGPALNDAYLMSRSPFSRCLLITPVKLHRAGGPYLTRHAVRKPGDQHGRVNLVKKMSRILRQIRVCMRQFISRVQ